MDLKGISGWSILKILIIVLITLGATTLLLLFFIPGSPLEDALLDFLEWLESLPKWQGILMLTLVETVCTVLILPATPLNLASGFLFGVWWGSLISVVRTHLSFVPCSSFQNCKSRCTTATATATKLFISQSSTDIASVISFFIGRYVARGWAEKEIEKRPKFKAVDAAVEKQGMWIIILVRFSPVFPFGLWCVHINLNTHVIDVLFCSPARLLLDSNYLFGLTKVSFVKYWIATTIGLLPCVSFSPATHTHNTMDTTHTTSSALR